MIDPLDQFLAPPKAGADPLDTLLGEQHRRAASANIARTTTNPEQAGKANQLAREFGLPPETVERNLGMVEGLERLKRAQSILSRHPLIANWTADPRNAAVAQDDMDNLAKTARTIQARKPKPFALLDQGYARVGGGLQRFVGTSLRALGASDLAQRYLNVAVENEAVAGAPVAGQTTWQNVKRNPIPNLIPFGLEQGASSLADMIMAGSAIGLPAYMLSQTGRIGQERAQNDKKQDAEVSDLIKASPAAVVTALLERFGAKGIVGQGVGQAVAKEAATEFLQEGTEYAAATVGTEAGFDPAQALDQSLAGAVGGGTYAAGGNVATKAVRKTADVLKTRAQARQAQIDADFLTELSEGAAESKVRQRDPSAFARFIEMQTEGSPVENLYIPGEKVVELYQSNDMDWHDSEDPFFGYDSSMRDQIDQAVATGGDIVVKTSDFAAHLAGTPAWDALKDHVRASADGMSLAEAKDWEGAFDDAMNATGEEFAALVEAERAGQEPRLKIAEAMRDKLMQAGFRPDVAMNYAEMTAARYATRAQRLGLNLDGSEIDGLEVRAPEDGGAQTGLAFNQSGPERTTAEGIPIARGVEATQAFDAWFGKSKAASVSGAPVTLFHGTDGNFEAFDKSKRGKATRDLDARGAFFLSDSPEVASTYANLNGPDPVGQNIIPAVVSLQNPLIRDMEGRVYDPREFIDIINEAKDAGHDGVIFRNVLDGALVDDAPSTTYAVFEPTQIKSVHNQGTFDPNDPRILNQSYMEGVRGRITFAGGKSIIDLFEARDLSTFIHESGHLYLEEFWADSADSSASDQLKADRATLVAWFKANGIKMPKDGSIPVEAHELWARGFERFAMEGKAPSSALRKAFDAFRSWLLTVYKVVDNLRAPITPEVRGVMERLLATDEEITAAAEEQAVKSLFSSAAEAGMTDAEFASYQAASTEARDEAYDALLYRTMAALRQQRTKAWKDEEAGVRADVTERVDREPVFRAIRLLRTGKIGESEGQKVKLDRAWLVETYGPDALALLPKGVPPIYSENGATSADMIAEMTGFSSGDEMVRTLMGLESRQKELREGGDKRSVRQVRIDEDTAQAMQERHGDILNDGTIEDEARALIHNDKQGEVIASEIRALARRANRKPTPYAIARQWAARTIAEGKVSETTSGAALARYERAARKAGKLAEAAMLSGDIDETYRQKQTQMLNNALIAEGKKAKDAVDTAVRRLGKLARRVTIKSIDQDHLDQVHQLLEQVEFRPRSQRDLDRQQSYEEWATAQQSAGFDIVTPPSFAASLGTTHWSRLTVEQIMGLDETVKQIVHLGRLKQKLQDNQDQREREEVISEALGAIGQLPPIPPSDLMEPSRWDAIKSRVAAMDAALLKMETVFDWLDSGNPNGVFNRIVFRPIAAAQDTEKAMLAQYIDTLSGHLAAIPKEQLRRWSEKVTAPELLNRETGNPYVLTRDQLVSMALNMGNEGNASKLAGGYGWNEAAIMAVLNRELSADDWAYVQNVWDTVESLWPQIAALEKRLNGVEPEKIVARPLETSAGPLKGGYFPVVYDPRKSIEADLASQRGADSLFENSYTRATTPKGFTKARTKVERPIHLSLGVINRHIGEVIHDLTHREAVMQADRFLADRRIAKAVDETLGPEVRKQFRPWLQHIANEWASERVGLAGWEAFIRKLRTNTSMVGMGFRISTMMMQVAGYSNSFERVGAKWVTQGIAATIRNPVEAYRFVMSRSGEVANRMDTLERDIRENVRATLGDRSIMADVKRFAFYGIGYMDRVVVIPTWLGAYNRGISEGMSEADAGYYADKAVRQSQGAGAAKDLASVQRKNEFQRLLTMFYSYQSAVYQRMRTLGRDAGMAKAKDVPNLIARSFWLLVVPPLLSELLAGRGPADDEDEAMWAFQKTLVSMFGPIPVARDAANALESGFGYSFTPAARAVETVLNVAKDAKKVVEGEETKRATRNALEGAGYVLGLPTGQFASAAQFIVNVSEGEQDPESLGDWWEGLTKGKIED